MQRSLALVAAFALLVSACSASAGQPTQPAPTTSADPAQANGFTATTLAEGKVPTLPGGTLYMNVIDIPEAGGQTITHAHVPGFVYSVAGTHRMSIDGGETFTLVAGQAGFVGTQSHAHINPDGSANDWYFISIRPIAARTAPPLVAQQKVLFETPDLSALPPGPYTERLMLVTLAGSGRGAPHTHGGTELLFVLDGSVRLQLDGQTVTLSTGQGFWHLPGTCIQDINAGATTAKMLAFFITPDVAPFRTDQGICK